MRLDFSLDIDLVQNDNGGEGQPLAAAVYLRETDCFFISPCWNPSWSPCRVQKGYNPPKGPPPPGWESQLSTRAAGTALGGGDASWQRLSCSLWRLQVPESQVGW